MVANVPNEGEYQFERPARASRSRSSATPSCIQTNAVRSPDGMCLIFARRTDQPFYSFSSILSRLVCTRLTGISVCFLSSIRNI